MQFTRMSKRAHRLAGMAATALVLALIVYNFSRSPEWRGFDWRLAANLLRHARAGYLLLAVLLLYTCLTIRAVRWKFFLRPVKTASLWNLFVAQIYGFGSIFLIGRPGEIVRPAYIANREGVSFTSQLAILILERVYDAIAMGIIFALALHFTAVRLTGLGADVLLHRMRQASVVVLLVTAALVLGLVVFRLSAETVTLFVERRIGFLPARFRSGPGRVLRSLAAGLGAIRSWRDLTASVVCTILHWTLNVTMFWVSFRSLGGELLSVSWWGAAIAAFLGGIGLAFQLPGVGGGIQIAIIESLKRILGVAPEAAVGGGILIWALLTFPVVGLGLVLLPFQRVSFRRLEAMADVEAQGGSAGASVPQVKD
jgi:uncharacterized protein (TIRG00374 family)